MPSQAHVSKKGARFFGDLEDTVLVGVEKEDIGGDRQAINETADNRQC
jgi:hypothetical protein